jgi:hypothetical protein
MATAEIQTRTTNMKMTTTMMKKKKGKVVKSHQTRRVEQGPRTPLERAPHVVSTQD